MTTLPTQDAAVTAEEAKTMQDTPELLPLPEPQTLVTEADVGDRAYTSWQMREYARSAILADRATRLAAAPWMPIETAPNDSTELLVLTRTGSRRIETGRFLHSMLEAAKLDWDDCFYVGWMDLPPAPDAAPAASSPEVADERAAMFDAFGNPRKRYVRITHDGTHCIAMPGNVQDMVDQGRISEYVLADVYLSEREFNDLPEFDGF